MFFFSIATAGHGAAAAEVVDDAFTAGKESHSHGWEQDTQAAREQDGEQGKANMDARALSAGLGSLPWEKAVQCTARTQQAQHGVVLCL